MTYETTPTPPPPNKGGRPRQHEALMQALIDAPAGEWVIVPPNPDLSHASLLTTLRRKPYKTDRKLRSRIDSDGNLYLRLAGTK